MKIMVRRVAWQMGRAFTLGEARKPTEKKIAEACPFEYTEPGTPDIDKKHQNGLRAAWLKGAMEARAEYVTPSKRAAKRKADARAQARREYQQRAKLQAKGYTLAV